MNRNFTFLALLFSGVYILSGCRSTGGTIEPIPPQPRIPPAEAMQLCPALDVDLGQAGLADLARALQGVAEQYHECKGRHGQLVDWVERDSR